MRQPGAAAVALSLALACAATGLAATQRDNLYDVHAISPTEAWAVGNFGTIVHTTDSGKTWQVADSGTLQPIFGIDFSDAQHAWAVGKSALVLRTEDGGKTWKTQRTP